MIFLFFTGVLSAQTEIGSGIILDTLMVFEDLFEDEEPIHLTLKFDIKNYQKTRSKEEYQPAELIYRINDSLTITHDVRLRTRGEFRKKFCALPPFWLNIKDANIRSETLQGVKKMKVVTHCRNSKIYKDYILKEYLVYKMFNIISPYSFRVRLLKMIYVDTGRYDELTENWAFIIEPEAIMARRLEGVFIENDRLAMATVDDEFMDRLAIFQYMIGNADYSVTGRHNLKIFSLDNPGSIGYIPVPYDFDYTGFVNTTYAVPSENLGIKSVRERYYLGPCRSDDTYNMMIQELNDKKSEILELLQPFEYMTIKQKIEMLKYIESYFTAASADRFIQRELETTCR